MKSIRYMNKKNGNGIRITNGQFDGNIVNKMRSPQSRTRGPRKTYTCPNNEHIAKKFQTFDLVQMNDRKRLFNDLHIFA